MGLRLFGSFSFNGFYSCRSGKREQKKDLKGPSVEGMGEKKGVYHIRSLSFPPDFSVCLV